MGEVRFLSKLKSIESKYPHDICSFSMKLFLFTFIKVIGQMFFLKEHLQETAFAITTNISLTKDWNKNIVGASVTASTWKSILKNIS